QVGQIGPDLRPPLREVEVCEDGDGDLAVVRDVLDLRRGESRVDRHGSATGVDDTEVGHDVLGPVGGLDGDELALADPEGLQTGSHLMDPDRKSTRLNSSHVKITY